MRDDDSMSEAEKKKLGENFWENLRKAKGEMCKEYVAQGKPQKTQQEKGIYKTCCEEDYYCAIWAQPWFWWTIGGILLALIIICVLGCVWCCCIRKRGGAGKNEMEEGKKNENRSSDEEVDSSEDSCESD